MESPFIIQLEHLDELIAALDRLATAIASTAAEAERQYTAGKTEEGGFAVEEEKHTDTFFPFLDELEAGKYTTTEEETKP